MSVNLWKKVLGALSCLALLCTMVLALPAAPPAQAEPVEAEALKDADFTLLHTNDEHSEMIPADLSIDYPTYPTTGGISRIAHEIGRIEAEKAAVSEPVLVTNSGDFSQGTFFAWLETVAASELSLLQGIGYDVVALGNHEFDQGAGYRALALNSAIGNGVTLPVLSSNIRFDDTNPEAAALHALWSDADLGGTALAIQPYTVKTLSNGLNVGFFSLLGVEAEAVAPMAAATGVTFGNVYNPDGTPDEEASFLPRVFKAQEMVNTLKGLGCDVVVCLSHMGTTEELMLCGYVTGLDVILGGHSHDLNYPPIVRNGVIVVQAGAYTKYLGELELNYKETQDPVTLEVTGEVTLRNGQAIRIDDSVPSVPAIDAWVANYVTAINGFTGMDVMAPVAETDIAGDGGFDLNEGPAFTETGLGDLITDSYVAIASAVNPAEPVQLGIEANGVIRSGIPRGGTGVFDSYDLYRALPLGATPDVTQPVPFGYPLCAFYLFGAEIAGALDATLGMGANDFFLQMSGGRYTYDPSGPPGGRIVSFMVDDGAGGYAPLNPAGLYKIATNFYTASFLAMFGLAPRDNTGAPTTIMASRVMIGPNEVKGWEALFQYVMLMPDLDGDGLPNVIPMYMNAQERIASVWNMAEGSTDGGMETYILVQNPGDTDAHVNIKFLTGTGEVAPVNLQGVAIAANSRATFKANDYVATYDVSTKVEPLDGFVVCERAVYGGGRTWGTDSIGATAPAPSDEWYLAEGYTGGGFETYILVENPGGADVHVDMTFQTGGGQVAPVPLQGVTIPALSRCTFKVNDYLADSEVSTMVTCTDGAVVCERAMYGGDRTWGTDSIGATDISPRWYLAEGSTMGGMETYVLVQNPDVSAVLVNIAFHTDTGLVAPAALQGVAIDGMSRQTFNVNDYVSSYNVSTMVTCVDKFEGVVCERAMYGGGRTWAHDSVGATSPGADWYMAEGCTAGGMETFVLIQNPTSADAVVNVTFQTGAGPVAPAALQGMVIPANSRHTIDAGLYVADNYDVSTHVLAISGKVVCERAMYGGGRTWGTDSIAHLR